MSTDNKNVVVPHPIINQALVELTQWAQDCVGDDGMVEMPRTMVQSFVEILSEDLGCDHAVNICTCGTAGLMSELMLALDGKQHCRACGGDGHLWSQRQYDEAVADLAKLGIDRNWSDDSLGYYPCPTCKGQGITALPGLRS